MATAAFTISPVWTKAADGPCSVLIPAFFGFYYAISDNGAAPAVDPKRCPSYKPGEELSLELVDGESLWCVSPGNTFDTSVTSDA